MVSLHFILECSSLGLSKNPPGLSKNPLGLSKNPPLGGFLSAEVLVFNCFMAEPPVLTNELTGLRLSDTLLCSFHIFCWWNNHVIAQYFIVWPVCWQCNLVFLVHLEALNHTQDLIQIATKFLWVVQNCTYLTRWVNNEDCTYSISVVTLTWVNET